MKKLLFVLFSFLIYFTIFIDQSSFPTTSRPQENGVTSNNNHFYPVNSSKFIKYHYPSRPFDTNVELIGFSWEDGSFTVIFETTLVDKTNYSYIPKFFSPTVEHEGKKYVLAKKLWTEGSLEAYGNNKSRYAVTSENLTIEDGTIPESIKINGVQFELPSKLPKPVTYQKLSAWKGQLGNVDHQIDIDGRSYIVEKLESDGENSVLTLNVESSKEHDKENYFFLLRDKKERIYSFKKSSIPYEYTKGNNKVELQLNDAILEDYETLELVIFKGEFVQSYLFEIAEEKSVEIY